MTNGRHFASFNEVRPAPRGRPLFSLSKRKSMVQRRCCGSYGSSGDFSQEMSTAEGACCWMVSMDSSNTSWAWVAPAGAASSSVRTKSWLKGSAPWRESGTLPSHCSPVAVFCLAHVASPASALIGGRRSASGGGRHRVGEPNRYRSDPLPFSGASYTRWLRPARPGRWFPGSRVVPSVQRAGSRACPRWPGRNGLRPRMTGL